MEGMNAKTYLAFGLFFALLFGGAFYAEYSGKQANIQNVKTFKAAPKAGDVVEIEYPKTAADPVMYGYFHIDKIEGNNFVGRQSVFKMNSPLAVAGISKPGFFQEQAVSIPQSALLQKNITNVMQVSK